MRRPAALRTQLAREREAGDKMAPLIDLIGDLGREVHWLIDDCETSGPVDAPVHTITDSGLEKVSAILDRIEALPFEEPGCALGPGAMLEAAITQTLRAALKGAADD